MIQAIGLENQVQVGSAFLLKNPSIFSIEKVESRKGEFCLERCAILHFDQ